MNKEKKKNGVRAREYFGIYGAKLAYCAMEGLADEANEAAADMMQHMFDDMQEEHKNAVEMLRAEGADEGAVQEFARKKYGKLLRSYNQKWNAIRSMIKAEYGKHIINYDGFLTSVLAFLAKDAAEENAAE